ncbi:Aminotransferase class I and II [seawater metagenome]|uniref:Aminotransferase class I and II n=1 Tax=seawater metagenome TaxID=1561972 RepID=A0A5E8CL63_9ZZZZ
MKISSTLYAKQIKSDRQEKGLKTFDGGLGENPFPQPLSLVNTLKKYASLKSYTNVQGIKELREILGDNLIIGNGLKPLLFLIQLAFSKTYANGKIFHIIPSWVSYMEQTNILNIDTHQIIQQDPLGKIQPDELDKGLSLTSEKSLIIFNNPTNPTGLFYTKKEVKEIAKVFKKHKTIVISDIIYQDLVHQKYKNDIGKLEDYYDLVINGASLSKNVACGGYRFGWLNFKSDKLKNLYDCTTILASSIYSCPSLPFQYVALEALKYPKDVRELINKQRVTFQEISEYCQEELSKLNLEYSKSNAAWYFLISFENYKNYLNSLNIFTSDDLCQYLIKNSGLITVAGSAFGIKKKLILRYSYVDLDIKIIDDKMEINYKNIREFLKLLKNFLKK